MLKAIVQFSLRYRGVVLVLACLVVVYGIYISRTAELDVFPNFVPPQVAIQTECPGLAPEQVELLVTVPIESMINGLGEMESLRSESIEGLSIITAVFKENADVFRARQLLGEILSETAGKLPAGVMTPRMTPLTSSTMDLLKIGLVSDKLTPMQLRTFADWTLKPRLLSVPGVAKCSSFGGEVRQFQIQVIPERLLAYNLALADVLAAARVSTGVKGAGFIETSNQRIILQTEGQARTPEELGEVVILHTNEFSVRIKDLARVVEGSEPKFGDTVIQGRPGVLLTMSSQYGANTMDTTKAVEKALAEMKPVLDKQGIQLYDRLHRPGTFIESAIGNIKHSIGLGGLLVAVVLLLLLGSLRTALISIMAIPLSLLLAVIVLQKFGITLNTITLGGLAIALGEVVDDSIIDVENIYRRLRERCKGSRVEGRGAELKAGPLPPLDARPSTLSVILDASLEVRRAVVYATFVVALIFLPVLTMTGLQGSFFAPLALSYILAIMGSLLVALTVTPALSLVMFKKEIRNIGEPRLQRWLKGGYIRVLGFVSRWPRIIIAITVVVCVAAATRLPFFGGDFLPEFREGHLVLQITAVPGTSLPEMLRLGTLLSNELLKNKKIATVEQQVGRAELGEDPWGPHRSEFHVELKPSSGHDQIEVREEVENILKQFPGIQFEVTTFLGDRIGETITGETAPVVINLFGDDLDLLDIKAQEVAHVLETVPGSADVKAKISTGAPKIAIRLRPEPMTQMGFRPVEVLETIDTAYRGTIVAQVHRDNQAADVSVILQPADRQDPESVSSLLVKSPSGKMIPLREIADVYLTNGRFSILHEGARRRQTVTCRASGRDVSSFVADARKAVAAKVNLPGGVYATFSGAAQAKERAEKELILHSAIAAVGILLLLSTVFHNWRNMLLVLANVPFALVGGVFTVWLHGLFHPGESSLTMGSLVGFVTLFGITTRNSIMMISHFEHLVDYEEVNWGTDAVLRGASERLMPILITATVTGLGLLPLALGAGEAGREIEGPMAIVILGGLITSTALNLLILPVLALRYGRFQKRQDMIAAETG
jgi:CzcA family heavy metal efflux pump